MSYLQTCLILWNILNRFSEKSRQSVEVSLDELYNYFKEMNEVEHEHIKIVINLNEDNHDDVLNVRMSQAEIENVILNLHNDKSSVNDL
jgi:Asp-tRNA(Asn)/Glu-tRNA(Gln) amidotransferase C subunit